MTAGKIVKGPHLTATDVRKRVLIHWDNGQVTRMLASSYATKGACIASRTIGKDMTLALSRVDAGRGLPFEYGLVLLRGWAGGADLVEVGDDQDEMMKLFENDAILLSLL